MSEMPCRSFYSPFILFVFGIDSLSAGSLNNSLDRNVRALWTSRLTVDRVILIDWHSTRDNIILDAPIRILREILLNVSVVLTICQVSANAFRNTLTNLFAFTLYSGIQTPNIGIRFKLSTAATKCSWSLIRCSPPIPSTSRKPVWWHHTKASTTSSIRHGATSK